jgi:hypothetical protein
MKRLIMLCLTVLAEVLLVSATVYISLVNMDDILVRYRRGNNECPMPAVASGGMPALSGGIINKTGFVPVDSESLTSVDYTVTRTRMNFGASGTSMVTGPQSFYVNQVGGGVLEWTAAANAEWLNCTPSGGEGSGEVTVSVDPSQLSAGVYIAEVVVEALDAVVPVRKVEVTLKVFDSSSGGETGEPFGSFESPVDGAAVSGSIPVSGWALDDIGIDGVKIFLEDGEGLVYMGDAVRLEGARPDVELSYGDYPENYKAGWGYMMLTHFLPFGGNGTFTLHAVAVDLEGKQTTLGTRVIYCDNANAINPFGALDTPGQGAVVSGENYINYGWVLTPRPCKIPTDGSTIIVWVDGVNIGNPIYNNYRDDIASMFPDYANSDGAVGYFLLDTTQYDNGLHSIQWTAVDSGGNVEGIGSRYFTVRNTDEGTRHQATGNHVYGESMERPVERGGAVWVRKGFHPAAKLIKRVAGEDGTILIDIKELERLEIRINPRSRNGASYHGWLKIGPQRKSLPVGSSFDATNGIFRWSPGAGFLGEYRFEFIQHAADGRKTKTEVTVTIGVTIGR